MHFRPEQPVPKIRFDKRGYSQVRTDFQPLRDRGGSRSSMAFHSRHVVWNRNSLDSFYENINAHDKLYFQGSSFLLWQVFTTVCGDISQRFEEVVTASILSPRLTSPLRTSAHEPTNHTIKFKLLGRDLPVSLSCDSRTRICRSGATTGSQTRTLWSLGVLSQH